jgi:type VI secretion system secreted protein VgrG
MRPGPGPAASLGKKVSMTYLTEEWFSFTSQALPEDTFAVVDFTGREGLSQCYGFEVRLVSSRGDLDQRQVLGSPAVFTIRRPDGDIPFHGILSFFEQHRRFKDYYFYKARLAPKFWWLSLTHHNQAMINQALPAILTDVLKDGGLTPQLDFELRLQQDYPEWEYVCQYGESHLNFLSRWMERDGLYYFFEQTAQGEKVVVTDTNLSHTPMPEGRTMYYAPASGLETLHRQEVIRDFACRQQPLPRQVVLRDYNYRTPSLEMVGQVEVSPKGRGQVYVYGEHFRTPEEGNRLAGIRAESLLCRQRVFTGRSTIPFLRPGYVFDLEDHYRGDYNQQYLTMALEHRGSQAAYLVAGLGEALGLAEQAPHYENDFQAIPARVQFRAEHRTPKARIYGTMSAKIDAAGSGKYAELDEQGRYKVILPFDLSGRKDGKASSFLRMAQPYTGADHGMHFPLHKGTEAILTFIDGDPDRPIIAGAAPNPENPSPVTAESETKNMITTGGQNKIHLEDQAGSQRILMQTPTSNTWVRLGAVNDPWPPPAKGMEGIALYTSDALNVNAGFKNSQIHGDSTTTIVGGLVNTCFIFDNKTVLGWRSDVTWGVKFTSRNGGDYQYASDKILGWPSRVQSAAAKTAAYGAVNRVVAGDGNLLAASTDCVTARVQELADSLDVTAAKQSLHEETVQAVANKTQAVGQALDAEGVRTQAVATVVRGVGSNLGSAGSEMSSYGIYNGEFGNSVQGAAVDLHNAGLAVSEQGFGQDV